MTRRRSLAWAVATLAASLALIAWVAIWGEPSFDETLVQRASGWRDGVVGAAMHASSWFGYASRIVPVIACVVVVLTLRARHDAALVVALASLLGLAGFWSLKHIVERPRPDIAAHAISGWSMPSGHATTAFALAVSLIVAVPWIRGRRWRSAALLVWASLTAVSRVVLGVHYVTDVVAGALLGTGCALLAFALVNPRPSR